MGSDEKVSVFEKSFTLKQKIGEIDITALLTDDIVTKAQEEMQVSAKNILPELNAEITKLTNLAKILSEKKTATADMIKLIISSAFFVKSNAGFCSLPQVTDIARSLYMLCEIYNSPKLMDEKKIDIVLWHIKAISMIMTQKTSNGPEFDNELKARLKKIKDAFIDNR